MASASAYHLCIRSTHGPTNRPKFVEGTVAWVSPSGYQIRLDGTPAERARQYQSPTGYRVFARLQIGDRVRLEYGQYFPFNFRVVGWKILPPTTA